MVKVPNDIKISFTWVQLSIISKFNFYLKHCDTTYDLNLTNCIMFLWSYWATMVGVSDPNKLVNPTICSFYQYKVGTCVYLILLQVKGGQKV